MFIEGEVLSDDSRVGPRSPCVVSDKEAEAAIFASDMARQADADQKPHTAIDASRGRQTGPKIRALPAGIQAAACPESQTL